uniref:BTB domain-containing protein n=1 Tax=Panagrolaimus davidi TaxID=227884 RepID=A0A914QS18_9BILA
MNKQKINFIYPWILPPPSPLRSDEDNNDKPIFNKGRRIITSYNVTAIEWELYFTNDRLMVFTSTDFFCNPICNVSYKIFSHMDVELYSSPVTSALSLDPVPQIGANTMFGTPDGFMDELKGVCKTTAVGKVVIVVELLLPLKIFFRPFDHPLHPLNKEICAKYPENMQKDFTFEFLNDSDFSIKCPNDYSIPASKMLLNLTSKFMRKHFKKSKENELVVEHKIDVVKPIIYYLHSACFEIPKSYDLDFADRILKAIDFFVPVQERQIMQTIELSFCQKFCNNCPDFDSILQWIRVTFDHRLHHFRDMINAIIANNFYQKWIETFPENARNPSNRLFYKIFGFQSRGFVCELEHNQHISQMFDIIESTFTGSLLTNASFP